MVLSLFGLTAFAEKDGKKILTPEQRQKLVTDFGEAHAELVEKELEKLNNPTHAATDNSAQITALTAQIAELNSTIATLQQGSANFAAEKANLEKQISNLNGAIKVLGEKPANNPPAKPVEKGAIVLDPTNKESLMGINVPMMKIDASRPYNLRAYQAIMSKYGVDMPAPKANKTDYKALQQDLMDLYASTSLDYTELDSQLGSQYRVRMQDRIQSFLTTLKSVESIFPMKSGYQDQAVLVNMFMGGDFSQADNSNSSFDNVVSGSYTFEPEILRMYDVMFAQKFTNLKAIEKEWIGYLNQEGSSSMKWSFVEYLLVEASKKLFNERELRRIKGKRVNPTLNVPGTALGASTGLYEFIKSKVEAFQIKEYALGAPTASNIASYVKDMVSRIPAELRDSGNLALYMPSIWVQHYNSALETLYGANTNYKGDIMWVKEYPAVSLISVPNADVYGRFIVTIKNNICLFEDVPGEMYNFSIEQVDWSLKVHAQWKESLWALMVGKKFASAAEQDYDHQMIFVNDVHYSADYYHPMTADDTTPSVATHNRIVSVANAAATAITNIDDAVVGEEIYLRVGSVTNTISIAASGNFSLISADWSPTNVGEEIVLMKRADGKFIELQRINAVTEAIAIAADDTTPDVAAGTEFVTNANTKATAITNFDNATAGVIYTIYGAGSTNASTIANSGNFVLTAAMTLAADAWIKLVYSSATGKFHEISRNA